MDLLFLLGFLTCTLRNWNPRPACGTAFSSVHNISSVCVSVSVSERVGVGVSVHDWRHCYVGLEGPSTF